MGILSPRWCVVAALVSCVSCVPTFDDQLSVVSEPRLLAVQSEPAEAAPGEPITLRALVPNTTAAQATPALSTEPAWMLAL